MTSTQFLLAAVLAAVPVLAPGLSQAQLASSAPSGARAEHGAGADAQSSISTPDDDTAHPIFDLNAADAHQLEQLPGVGPRRAQAILELRTKLRGFTRLEQLLQVKGIGRATFRKLRPWLTLERQASSNARP